MIIKKIKIFLLISFFLLSSFTTIETVKSNINNNSRVIDFFKSIHKPILIDGDDSFIAKNGVISGNGTIKNPFIIANWKIRLSLKDIFYEIHGISIKNTKSYFIIDNCFIHFLDGRIANMISKIKKFNGSNGINLYNVSNGQIKNCFIKGMGGSINIENNSHKNLIIKCVCFHNYCGIGINRGSNNNKIEKCNTCNYGCGICLWDNTSNNSINNCNCRKVGIRIFNSSKNKINGCTLSFCLNYPAMNIFDNSSNNIIQNCSFYFNNLGLKIYCNSNKNVIYNNNFIINIKPAYDNEINQWDNGTIGNYWSDFKDVDENKDGIFDHERLIYGGNSLDRFPLVTPIVN